MPVMLFKVKRNRGLWASVLADNETLNLIKGIRSQSTCRANQSDEEALHKVVTKVIIRLIVKVATKVILVIWRHLRRHNLPSKVLRWEGNRIVAILLFFMNVRTNIGF